MDIAQGFVWKWEFFLFFKSLGLNQDPILFSASDPAQTIPHLNIHTMHTMQFVGVNETAESDSSFTK